MAGAAWGVQNDSGRCLPPGLPVRNTVRMRRKPGRPRNEPPPEPQAAAEFLTSTRHFLPELTEWMARVRDPRKRLQACTYSMEEILMLAVVMLCAQCGSRKQLDRDTARKDFLLNFRVLVGNDEAAVTCADNMNRVLSLIRPSELEKLAARCSKALNRRKVLRRFKCDGMLVIAIDGTQIFKFKTRHCKHCLTRTLSNGKTEYYHYVLAAKIVTPVGLILPAAFEFIENPAGKFHKQDCETKAFRRLAPRLRKLFKGFDILLVGDGLYANEPFMEICEKRGWSYMVTLKDDQLPTLQEQVARAKNGCRVVDSSGRPRLKPNMGLAEEEDEDTRRVRNVRWITPLRYRRRTVHMIEMTENRLDKQTYHNVWITDLKPNKTNAMTLAKAGRMRWKIENEGINTQKTGGYEMEHGYGVKKNAWKNYYLLMQIAQLLNDLYRLGDLPAKLAQDTRSTFAALYGSLKNFARRLMESLRNDQIDPESGPDPGSIQIRLPDPPQALMLN